MRTVTSDIAHDLRQPISRLRSRIEVTLMGPHDPEVYGEALQVTLAETDDILTMFNALLTIAVAESGAPRESFESIDLSEIARSAVELYRPAAEEAGLDIRLRADRPVPLSGNPHLIMQALSNLLDNAIKYAKDSGAVWVRVDEKDGQAILGVADRGPGILDEFRDRAFDRFTRQEESRTTPGSGLGLSLVRAVARLHGGVVELEDNEPGLEIHLRLPTDRVSIVG
jgi:signal transduction histidine kinase